MSQVHNVTHVAPFARTGTQYLYTEARVLEHIQSKLRLSSSLKGENVVVSVPKDTGVFLDAYEPVPGIRCTSPVQTYLGLSVSGEVAQRLPNTYGTRGWHGRAEI